jgi:hypothetical protein
MLLRCCWCICLYQHILTTCYKVGTLCIPRNACSCREAQWSRIAAHFSLIATSACMCATLLQILAMRGGWQTVAAVALSAVFRLPGVGRHLCGRPMHQPEALIAAASCLAPAWPFRWQRWPAWVLLAMLVADSALACWRHTARQMDERQQRG